jgi:hypothetical protein
MTDQDAWNTHPERLVIQKQGDPTVIEAPRAVVEFAHALVAAADAPFHPHSRNSTSLWIAHQDGRAMSTSEIGFGFDYLLKTADGELRMWGELEFIPKLVFRRLLEEYQSYLGQVAGDGPGLLTGRAA